MQTMVMIDGPMIINFIEDSETFKKCADEKFQLINQKEGKVAESMAFEQDESQDYEFQAVDLDKYKEELKEMMKAIAQGIGNTPVNVLVEEGSLLLKVYEMEIERIKKEYEEEEEDEDEQEEEEKMKNNNNVVGEDNSVSRKVIYASKKKKNKDKKKRSFDFLHLNLCACSGKQFVVDEKN